MPDPWELLRSNKIEDGINIFRKAYEDAATPSHIMEFGVALLWARKYSDATAHFQDALNLFPKSSSAFYEMAGVARGRLKMMSSKR